MSEHSQHDSHHDILDAIIASDGETLDLAKDRETLPDVEPLPQPPQLATLERLGRTAVATVTVTELSGVDAKTLMVELLQHVEGGGIRHFVFDLQNVSYIDSACIGVMVEMLTLLQKSGGRIALANTAQSVSYLFRLTQLDRVFPICRDVMEAINAVERGGAAP